MTTGISQRREISGEGTEFGKPRASDSRAFCVGKDAEQAPERGERRPGLPRCAAVYTPFIFTIRFLRLEPTSAKRPRRCVPTPSTLLPGAQGAVSARAGRRGLAGSQKTSETWGGQHLSQRLAALRSPRRTGPPAVCTGTRAPLGAPPSRGALRERNTRT